MNTERRGLARLSDLDYFYLLLNLDLEPSPQLESKVFPIIFKAFL